MSTKKPDFIKWFADTRIEDIPLVGGKNASRPSSTSETPR